MSTYLITGVAGFIGSKVAELLLQAGHTVRGIDNFDPYYDAKLKLWRLEQIAVHRNFSFVCGNIEQTSDLAECARSLPSIDAVIHLAARAGVRPSVSFPAAYFKTNLFGTLNVLELCRELTIPKIVIASSSSVYGDSLDTPFREDGTIAGSLSPYAATKKAAEDICFTYHHLHKLDVSALRFFTVYGPAGRPDMGMFRFIQSIVEGQPITIFGKGTQSRDFSYVDDIARGVILALKPTGFRTINLGANRPFTVNAVIQIIEELSGREAKRVYRPADPSDAPGTWADVTRASIELGWSPSVQLEQGVERTLNWYLAHRSWASQLTFADPKSEASQLYQLADALGLQERLSAARFSPPQLLKVG